MRKLILHIGAHRTATTTLQKTLRKNFKILLKQGFLYPYGVDRHEQLANRLLRGKLSAAALAADLDRRAEADGRDVHSIILSDEDICMRRDLSVLAPLKDHFEVVIVYFLRRQDLWLESWYLQNVKGQWNRKLAHLTFDEFLDRMEEFHWIDYDRCTRHLDAVFGAGNVLAQAFERSAMPDGPVARFCELVGIAGADGFTPARDSNSSLSPLVTEFMRRLPLDTAAPAYRRKLVAACAEVDRGMRDADLPKLLLTPARRVAVLDRYAAGNRALARRRFDREALFLDPLPAADAPIAEMRLPESDELMARFVAPLVAALIEQNR